MKTPCTGCGSENVSIDKSGVHPTRQPMWSARCLDCKERFYVYLPCECPPMATGVMPDGRPWQIFGLARPWRDTMLCETCGKVRGKQPTPTPKNLYLNGPRKET